MNPELYSKENFVKCWLCKETYKDARILPCVHSFCIGCLYSSTETNTSNGSLPRCPLCKKEFKTTDEGLKGLRKDPLVEKLVTAKILSSSRSPDKYCEEYHEDRTGDGLSVKGLPKAECYCVTCSQYLCCSCGVGHGKNKLSKTHGLVNFGSSHETIIEHFRNCSSAKSCIEHKEPTILYCINCRCPVCATCLTGEHFQHQLLPVTQAAEGLCGELRGLITGASNLASFTGNTVQKIQKDATELTRRSEDCERTISSAIDALRRLVDAAGKALMAELRRLKQIRLDERNAALVDLQQRLGSIEHLTKYCVELEETASPSDLCEVFETLKNRFDELKTDRILLTDDKSDEFETVLERNKDTLSSEENILEKLKEMKNSNISSVEFNDFSHFLKVPRIEESRDENAVRCFPFRKERTEKQRGFLDLSKEFDTISPDSPTYRTAEQDERVSIGKTPSTLNKISSFCTRTLLSSIISPSSESLLQGCADHDQDPATDPSTKSGGIVPASIERGEIQLDEREQESIIIYTKSGFNGDFNDVKDTKNQEHEQRTLVTSTETPRSKPNKRFAFGEIITIDDDSKSSNEENTITTNVKITENLATDDVKMRSMDTSEAERISESHPDTKCTRNVFNFERFSGRNNSNDRPIVKIEEDDDGVFSVERSSVSSLDLVECVSSSSDEEDKLKLRRKTFDRISSSTDEESKRRENKTGEEFIISNFEIISSILEGDPSASNAAEDTKGKGKLNPVLNSANGGMDEIASGSAFRFIKQEDDDDDDDEEEEEEEFVARHPNISNTIIIDHDYADVKIQDHHMEIGRRTRKRKRSSNDNKEERKAGRTLELIHKLSGQSSEINGVTHLQDVLYILKKKSVCTYQAKHPYSQLQRVQLKTVASPNDIAACARHSAVYITDHAKYHADRQRHCIWRLSADEPDAEPTLWLSGVVEPYTVSVNGDGDVVFLRSRPEESSIEVRGHDASLVTSIPLPPEMVNAEHAVQTSKGSFVVAHATADDHPTWTLSEVDRSGVIVRRLNRDCVLLDEPKHLALDLDDRVFVANWKRNEVVVLPGGLNWADSGSVFREGRPKDLPGRLCYIQDSNLLVVINDMQQSRVYIHTSNAREVSTRFGFGSIL